MIDATELAFVAALVVPTSPAGFRAVGEHASHCMWPHRLSRLLLIQHILKHSSQKVGLGSRWVGPNMGPRMVRWNYDLSHFQ